MRQTRDRRILGLAVAGVVVAADQITKTWAEDNLPSPRHVWGTLWVELTYNSGAAFSLGRGVTPVVVAVVILLVAGLLVFGRTATRRVGPVTAAGIGLLVGGAVGNLVDRVVRHNHGAVVDFIDIAQFGDHARWPIFNVADASIVIGAIVVALSFGRHDHPARRDRIARADE